MAKFNSENERIKRKYYSYLQESRGRSPKTVDSVVKALARYEEFAGFESFKYFNSDKAVAFKKHLLKSNNLKGEPLSASTILHTLNPLKEFLQWLADKQGYKRIKPTDTHYLNLNDKDKRKTRPVKFKKYPTIEQIRKVLAFNPKNDLDMRDRALFAFLAATAVRDGALIGIKLKHLDINSKVLVQDPNEVETKFSKWINTRLFPIGTDIHQIIIDWVKYLREELLFDDECPLFPKNLIEQDEFRNFKSDKLSREHWQSAAAVRDIIKRLFANAGIEYYSPHRFRDMLSALGREQCKTPAEMTAWGKNLGHENWATTFISYGGFTPQMQVETLERMEKAKPATNGNRQEILQKMQDLISGFE